MQEKTTNSDNNLESIKNYHVEKICEHLRASEISIQDWMLDFVASLCDVNKDEIFAPTDVVYLAHARWLYWFACRYMTGESYDKIAKQDFHGGHPYTARTVQNGVNKMSIMIDNLPLWKKRWVILKQIIKVYNEDKSGETSKITIVVPKQLNDVKIEIIKER